MGRERLRRAVRGEVNVREVRGGRVWQWETARCDGIITAVGVDDDVSAQPPRHRTRIDGRRPTPPLSSSLSSSVRQSSLSPPVHSQRAQIPRVLDR